MESRLVSWVSDLCSHTGLCIQKDPMLGLTLFCYIEILCLNKGSCIFILHWTLKIMQLVLNGKGDCLPSSCLAFLSKSSSCPWLHFRITRGVFENPNAQAVPRMITSQSSGVGSRLGILKNSSGDSSVQLKMKTTVSLEPNFQNLPSMLISLAWIALAV